MRCLTTMAGIMGRPVEALRSVFARMTIAKAGGREESAKIEVNISVNKYCL